MKVLIRILIIIGVIVFVFYYRANSILESKPLEGPNTSNVIPKTESSPPIVNALSRPEAGLSTWIGKESGKLREKLGEPNRYETSAFDYEWWVYNNPSTYMMVGVNNGIVTQVYIAGGDLDITPFKIGETLDDIYRTTILDSEVSVTLGENVYTFSMNEQDRTSRMLVQFEGLYAQLYMDEELDELQAVRFTDGETLVHHQPYEMAFVGELLDATLPSSYLQTRVDDANGRTLFELVNLFRMRNDLQAFSSDEELTRLAKGHSEEMLVENFFDHESPTFGTLKNRLETAEIEYDSVAENIAMAYYDGIEAAHGFLNSKDHRSVMLSKHFSKVGTGVFLDYYTQIFVKRDEENPPKKSNNE